MVPPMREHDQPQKNGQQRSRGCQRAGDQVLQPRMRRGQDANEQYRQEGEQERRHNGRVRTDQPAHIFILESSVLVRLVKSYISVVLRSITLVSTALILFVLAGCGPKGHRRAPAIARAYVGPAVLNLRSDIALKSSTVATVKHGEPVEILQQRRVFFRVRTSSGVEGWTSASQLLSAADMQEMKQLAERASRMPSQGEGSVYDALN